MPTENSNQSYFITANAKTGTETEMKMQKNKTPHIVLGVTGSIAAYKACEIVRLCIKRGWNVSVAMTPAAEKFVTPLTFGTLSRNPVATDMFESRDFRPEHISLADAADAFVIAPCTADVIAKAAHGIADDIVSTSFLATKAPVIIASSF